MRGLLPPSLPSLIPYRRFPAQCLNTGPKPPHLLGLRRDFGIDEGNMEEEHQEAAHHRQQRGPPGHSP